MSPLYRTLIRIGGGDAAALDLVPSASRAFAQIAITLLTTAGLATVSMFFFLTDAVHTQAVVAVLLAPLWGLVIFAMDRTLLLLGMGGRGLATTASVLGRLLAAALIGIVVSTPLTLRIFASDIDAQIVKSQAEQSELNKTWLADSQETQQVTALRQEVDDWENIAAGVLPTSFADPSSSGLARELAAAREALAADQHAADQAAILYNCDTYGGGRERLDDPDKCAPKPGFNGNSALYKAQAEATAEVVADDLVEIDRLEKQLTGANSGKLKSLRAQAGDKLPALRDELTRAEKALDGFGSGLESANNGNTGLLAQIAGLWRAGEDNKALMIAHLLLALLLVVVEVLPVMAKLLWTSSPGGKAYEEAMRSTDDRGVATAQAQRAVSQLAAETDYEAALLAKDAELDARQLEAEHELELRRVANEADARVAKARADDLAARGLAIDAEYGARREAELRRRAEAEFDVWLSAPARRTGPGFRLVPAAPVAGFAGDPAAVQQPARRWWGRRAR
ncbi:DUF4407 domain-containing protein [Nocardioides sp. LHD-245]|uniref:DUF4407 domain-containing protein n=1 Tax=Nocardioides sp. LHD-245 TaxID=3051387 RepID=UPI0027E2006D|nr:DUF4407 domain-containing protein [Nocardioides sp. LHD-245]